MCDLWMACVASQCRPTVKRPGPWRDEMPSNRPWPGRPTGCSSQPSWLLVPVHPCGFGPLEPLKLMQEAGADSSAPTSPPERGPHLPPLEHVAPGHQMEQDLWRSPVAVPVMRRSPPEQQLGLYQTPGSDPRDFSDPRCLWQALLGHDVTLQYAADHESLGSEPGTDGHLCGSHDRMNDWLCIPRR